MGWTNPSHEDPFTPIPSLKACYKRPSASCCTTEQDKNVWVNYDQNMFLEDCLNTSPYDNKAWYEAP
jgi:hypothetical protein